MCRAKDSKDWDGDLDLDIVDGKEVGEADSEAQEEDPSLEGQRAEKRGQATRPGQDERGQATRRDKRSGDTPRRS